MQGPVKALLCLAFRKVHEGSDVLKLCFTGWQDVFS